MNREWMKALGTAIVLVSLGFFAAGIVWPGLAERMLQLQVVTVAILYIGGRGYRSRLPTQSKHKAYNPFEGGYANRPVPTAPSAIRSLAAQLEGLADVESASRVPIPDGARRTITTEIERRLSDHRGVALDDPDHHETIRALVSEETWLLLAPLRTGGGRSLALQDPVPITHLNRILTDVESL